MSLEKVRQYMLGYLEGFTAGPDLEKIVKNIIISDESDDVATLLHACTHKAC